MILLTLQKKKSPCSELETDSPQLFLYVPQGTTGWAHSRSPVFKGVALKNRQKFHYQVNNQRVLNLGQENNLDKQLPTSYEDKIKEVEAQSYFQGSVTIVILGLHGTGFLVYITMMG